MIHCCINLSYQFFFCLPLYPVLMWITTFMFNHKFLFEKLSSQYPLSCDCSISSQYSLSCECSIIRKVQHKNGQLSDCFCVKALFLFFVFYISCIFIDAVRILVNGSYIYGCLLMES